MFSFGSHSSSESYIISFAVWFVVRMPPNGAMWPGSCSSAQTIVPPVGTVFGVALFLVAAAAGPASEPATSAPAPTLPAFSSSSRRLTVRSKRALGGLF